MGLDRARVQRLLCPCRSSIGTPLGPDLTQNGGKHAGTSRGFGNRLCRSHRGSFRTNEHAKPLKQLHHCQHYRKLFHIAGWRGKQCSGTSRSSMSGSGTRRSRSPQRRGRRGRRAATAEDPPTRRRLGVDRAQSGAHRLFPGRQARRDLAASALLGQPW